MALKDTASTSRVLNLGVIAARSKDDPDYVRRPLFRSCLNQAIILKHLLRSNERDLFDTDRVQAIKILIPFQWTDLSVGGRSILFGERGFSHTLVNELGIDSVSLAHDIEILELIDQLPSLDPFLMREHLLRYEKSVANCYFDISASDVQRMEQFVARELGALISMASPGTAGPGVNNPIGRMVQAILSVEVGERLEPLRMTLGMTKEEFREGAFSWRGFLYYKWVLSELKGNLTSTIKSIENLAIVGPVDRETKLFVKTARSNLITEVRSATQDVMKALKFYDDAFLGLVQSGRSAAFREFLIDAPRMFMEIGEKLGVVSHICSFWRFRFPDPERAEMTAEEASDFFREFGTSISRPNATEKRWSVGT